jgi:hypothetical protein
MTAWNDATENPPQQPELPYFDCPAPHSRLAGLEAATAFLTSAMVPSVSQWSRQWRMICPL